jgi:hypothetical protein
MRRARAFKQLNRLHGDDLWDESINRAIPDEEYTAGGRTSRMDAVGPT